MNPSVNTKEKLTNTENLLEDIGAHNAVSAPVKTKKTFVEPDISVPVDVLEATTFFQLTDSGATN
jgi:hypothetical protein